MSQAECEFFTKICMSACHFHTFSSINSLKWDFLNCGFYFPWYFLCFYSAFLYFRLSINNKLCITGGCCDSCFSSYSITVGQGTNLHISLSYQGRSCEGLGGNLSVWNSFPIYIHFHHVPSSLLPQNLISLSKVHYIYQTKLCLN